MDYWVGFDDQTRERLERVLRWYEAGAPPLSPGTPAPDQLGGGEHERWAVLAEHLHAGGEADASLLPWSKWEDGGAGGFGTPSITITVTDTTDQHWGVTGEYIRVRLTGGKDGPIWEVLSSGAPWHEATLAATLNVGSYANAAVTIKGQSRTVVVYDEFMEAGGSLASSTKVGIIYDVEAAHWVAINTSCV